MFSQTNRLLFTMLALLAGLNASACSKEKADVQPNAASDQTKVGSEPSQPPPPLASPTAQGARDQPMDPGMKDHTHPMGPGMEGHADKHDGGHP